MTYEAPPAPDTLGEHGCRFWSRIAEDFELEPWSLDILEQAALALDRAESCRQRIADDGEIVLDRFGQSRPHPLMAAERDARSAFRQLYKALDLEVDENDKRPPGRPPRNWSTP